MDDAEVKSKSQIKRELKALQDFVRRLVEISHNQLKQLPLSEPIIEEIVGARLMTKTALKRQIGYISKRITEEPVEQARELLDRLQKPDAQANARFHQLEHWREQLILDNPETVQHLVDHYQADRQYLRQLVRNAKREQQREAAPKSARILFQYLRKLTSD